MQDGQFESWELTAVGRIILDGVVQRHIGSFAHHIQVLNGCGVIAQIHINFRQHEGYICIADQDPVVAAVAVSACCRAGIPGCPNVLYTGIIFYGLFNVAIQRMCFQQAIPVNAIDHGFPCCTRCVEADTIADERWTNTVISNTGRMTDQAFAVYGELIFITGI
jgi:hypothetical protein